MRKLFTIGHSTHTPGMFLDLLALHGIEAVADVRSNPPSARLPWFNKDALERSLKSAGIRHVFLGAELGARRSERECYVDGVATYENIARTAAFEAGLRRVREGAERFRVALLCSEKDPLECHRTILVCRLLRREFEIHHILADGSLESHSEAEVRLLREEKIPADDLFLGRDELITKAYAQRGGKIAYSEILEPASQV